jgi:hypothetical protein
MAARLSDSANSTFRAEVPRSLLRSQAPAMRIILARIARHACDMLDAQSSGNGQDNLDVQRPHQVYCIDGGRGAGKTYTLLSLKPALVQLSAFRMGQGEEPEWNKFFVEHLDPDLRDRLSKPGTRETDITQVLHIIFPGEMEGGESLMEAIFAAMSDQLNDAGPSEKEKSDPAKTKRFQAEKASLVTRLRTEVAEGWYFARRFGLDAIIHDSIDYPDLVKHYETESRKAAKRSAAWRQFIREYLAFHKAATLTVLLDDSDIQPELTQDILHSIRMFLNHPQIITVLAGNLKAMRNSLIHVAMKQIASSMPALNSPQSPAAKDWRRIERKAIEEYLQKVLPVAQRFFLQPAELYASPDQPGERSDFEKITETTLAEVCAAHIDLTRKRFLATKFDLAVKSEILDRDAPNRSQWRHIEDFLGWWVFEGRYIESLAPRSARQIATFRDFFGATTKEYANRSRQGDPAAGRESAAPGFRGNPKRIAAVLFEAPENYTLIQRLSDEDANVPAWLRQQDLQSVWVGRRMFRINGRDVYQGSYTYDYICYRLDVGLAAPVRDNSEAVVPQELLPRPIGRRYMRRFFQPRHMLRRQPRLGVGRWIDHAAIPANCANFYDLGALPDISLTGEGGVGTGGVAEGHWEASLSERWVELIDDDQDDLVLRYFTEIVCERLRETQNLPTAALLWQLDPADLAMQETVGLYEFVMEREIASFDKTFGPILWAKARLGLQGGLVGSNHNSSAVRKAEKIVRDAERRDAARVKIFPNPSEETEARGVLNLYAAKRMIALYAALVTDLRRAWHAVRIHQKSPDLPQPASVGSASPEHERTSLAVIFNQGRMPLFTRGDLMAALNETPWIRMALEVFGDQSVTGAVAALRNRNNDVRPEVWRGLHLDESSVKRVFGSFPKVGDEDKNDFPDEAKDFHNWIVTVRAIGRASYRNWPVRDRVARLKENDRHIDDELDTANPKRKGWRLRVTQGSKEDDAVAGQHRKSARGARELVWLLYGLCPSLPAIIHVNLMSRVYQVVLLELASTSDAEAERVVLHEPAPTSDAAAESESHKHLTYLYDEIKEWGRLIGALAIAMRYVKLNCLHLYAKIFVQALQRNAKDAKRAGTGVTSDMQDLLEQWDPETAKTENNKMSAVVEAALGVLDRLFGHDPATDLSILPDVAPATLFGKRWMVDLMRHEGPSGALAEAIKEAGGAVTAIESKADGSSSRTEDPFSVRGIFGETEHWLWAANRFVRKFEIGLRGHPPPPPEVPETPASASGSV